MAHQNTHRETEKIRKDMEKNMKTKRRVNHTHRVIGIGRLNE